MTHIDSQLKDHLNRETAKIAWQELQKFYARGVVIAVAEGMDLIAVATALHRDDTEQVSAWLQQASICHVDDATAQAWLDAEKVVWAVVVAPWVLVQEINDE